MSVVDEQLAASLQSFLRGWSTAPIVEINYFVGSRTSIHTNGYINLSNQTVQFSIECAEVIFFLLLRLPDQHASVFTYTKIDISFLRSISRAEIHRGVSRKKFYSQSEWLSKRYVEVFYAHFESLCTYSRLSERSF